MSLTTTIKEYSYIPNNFRHKIIYHRQIDGSNFESYLRVDLSNMQDFSKWLDGFKENTNTEWNLRNSKPFHSTSKYAVNRLYICHNASYRKKEKLRDGSRSKKNMMCNAFLSVKIKKNGKFVRYRDPCVREGLRAIIRISFKHSHMIDHAESNFYLKRSKETTRFFVEYFTAGLNPAFSIIYHQNKLILGGKDVNNRRLNPPKAWVYALYEKWSKGLCTQYDDDLHCTNYPQRQEEYFSRTVYTNSEASHLLDDLMDDKQIPIKSPFFPNEYGINTTDQKPPYSVENAETSESKDSSSYSFMQPVMNIKLEILESDNLQILDEWDNEWDKLKLILGTSMRDKSLVRQIMKFLAHTEKVQTASQLSALLKSLWIFRKE